MYPKFISYNDSTDIRMNRTHNDRKHDMMAAEYKG